jgi:pentatricopeptide repeat protein
VIETRKTKLGVDHLDTLASINNLAVTYGKQGRWDEAESLFVQVIETRKTKLGVDHPDTLTSMNNLAFAWKRLGRDKETLKLMEECVILRTRILGTNHPDTLSSRVILHGWNIEELEINASINKNLNV